MEILIHTYIIGHYNPLVRNIDLVSHTTYVVCINFIEKWRNLQSKVDSRRHFFWETFHGNFIYSQSLCQKSAERKLPKKYFCILFWCLAWGLNSGFLSNKLTLLIRLWRLHLEIFIYLYCPEKLLYVSKLESAINDNGLNACMHKNTGILKNFRLYNNK